MTAATADRVDEERVVDKTGYRQYLVYFASSSLIQAVSLASGLIIVNRLPKSEYSYYTIAFTVISAVTAISNSGFTAAIYSIGARVREDPGELANFVASVLSMRRRVSLTLNCLSIPVMSILLIRDHAKLSTIAVLVGIVVLTGTTLMESTVFSDLLALEYQRKRLQLIGVAAQITRTGGALALLLLPLKLAAVPIAANLVAAWVALRMQKSASYQLVDKKASPVDKYRRELSRHFYNLLPVNIFVVFQGQLVVLLLGIQGETTTLANISALARFSMAFTVVSLTITSLSGPILARASDGVVRRTYFAIFGLCLAVVMGIVVSLSWAAPLLLWALGPQYAGLSDELRIVIMAGAITGVADIMRSLNQSRGWIDLSWVQIPLSLMCIAAGLYLCNMHSTMGAATFTAVLSLPAFLCQGMQAVKGMRSGEIFEPARHPRELTREDAIRYETLSLKMSTDGYETISPRAPTIGYERLLPREPRVRSHDKYRGPMSTMPQTRPRAALTDAQLVDDQRISSPSANLAQGTIDAAALAYVLLWIYEGALRKWVLPGLGDGLYFGRDLLVWGTFAWILLRRTRETEEPPPGPLHYLAALFFLFGVLQTLVTHGSPALGLVGILQYLSPVAAAVGLIAKASTDGRRKMIIAIIISVWVQLVVAGTQVLSPQNSFINRVGVDQYQNLVTVGQMVRASGTFTAPLGFVGFLTLATALAVAGLACRKMPMIENGSFLFRPIPLIAAAATACAISGARSAVFNIAIVLVAGMFLRRVPGVPGYFLFKAGALVAVVILAALTFFPNVIKGFEERFVNANSSESPSGRIIFQASGYLDARPTNFLMGDGMGIHSQAGINIAGSGTWIENEMQRWVAEMGLLGLFLSIGRQVVVVPMIIVLWRRIRGPDSTIPAMSFVALAPVMIAGQLNAQPSAAGFTAVALGLSLAGLRRSHA